MIDLPIAILDQPINIGSILLNVYLKHILGPRTGGRAINIGAGSASVMYRQREMFAASEYHTLESPASGIPATYTCSASSMPMIADASYDWIFSTSVLEHVDDPWAAAREQIRICKPGGYVYVHVPFAQPVHLQSTFTDYWRFTPEGIRKLFAGMAPVEYEVWGEDPGNPNSFAILFCKSEQPKAQPRIRWIEYPNEQPFFVVRMTANTQFEWPLWEMSLDPMHLAMELHDAWTKVTGQTEMEIAHLTISRRFTSRLRRRIGTFRTNGVSSTFDVLDDIR